MSNQYRQFTEFNLPEIDKEVLKFWKDKNIFEKSISTREGKDPFVFYEGPPSANGLPGIHHVMGRTIKDLFCRYKTLKGYKVERKGGWDTHGLPIEINVEKKLGIKKEDIGTKISVEEYNKTCREEVLRFKDIWDDITQKMGYWIDLSDPYITYKNEYIETLWNLLKQLYDKGFMYKGYTIQPYSPAAGTGLSTHELNYEGSYRDVKDTSVTAQFKIKDKEEYFLAWTTTPWTLPSNTALAVGKKITYVKVKTYNPYTHIPVVVILAKDLLHKYFKAVNIVSADLDFDTYDANKKGQKEIPYQILSEVIGSELEGIKYEQLLPYQQPEQGDAFRVILADYVTTEDGTGIVHIAPSFGADDLRVAQKNGIGALTMVDKQGKFIDEMPDFGGRYVKDYKDEENYKSVDIDIAIKLKTENKAFKVEKYSHNYPHCWRTNKPILYYPLDSWFVQVTKVKDRMVELNKTINWKPKSTGEGRFGNWLENVLDWNLSRSRYWGTPLPIWRTEGGEEEICIGSIAELKAEVAKAVEAGFMEAQLPDDFDLHKPYVDYVFLVSKSGKKMTREPDLIDVWFDSGAMPYAQWHYPFENEETFKNNFPADFIAEGVDQTRGWFYTLHALAVMLFDSVAYKNVVSNGLILDKNGVKMSKSLGNVVDPFKTLDEYGADVTRWFIISNSQPWDNLKFDIGGLQEVQRKFLGTLYNTYNFFAMYANMDGFSLEENDIVPIAERPEIDRWIISKLNSLIASVDTSIGNYEPTKAARDIQRFVEDELSNWYVRLCRKRYWKPANEADSKDKNAAYQTLHNCLLVISQLMSPIAPFFSELLYRNLLKFSEDNDSSVHLSDFPTVSKEVIDGDLEEKMQLSQTISSLVLSLRKKEKIKVRQPLGRILIPVLDDRFQEKVEAVEDLIKTEVNVKNIEFVKDTAGIFTKKIKPNFKELGKKVGGKMKLIQQKLTGFTQEDIAQFERDQKYSLQIEDTTIDLCLDDVVIDTEDVPGWLVNSSNGITVALDTIIDDPLIKEGFAREIVNKLQRLRKDSDYNLGDKIEIKIINKITNKLLMEAIVEYTDYICKETLANDLSFVDTLDESTELDINEEKLEVSVKVIN